MFIPLGWNIYIKVLCPFSKYEFTYLSREISITYIKGLLNFLLQVFKTPCSISEKMGGSKSELNYDITYTPHEAQELHMLVQQIPDIMAHVACIVAEM